jgi:hypothetical protein
MVWSTFTAVSAAAGIGAEKSRLKRIYDEQ